MPSLVAVATYEENASDSFMAMASVAMLGSATAQSEVADGAGSKPG